jgi:hypothetical protein
MDLKTQYVCLGALSIGKYTFDTKKEELLNTKQKRPVKVMFINKKYIYRLMLGYSLRVDVSVDEFKYLMFYGIFNPHAKVIHKDGDIQNNDKENLTLNIEGKEIPNDIKEKAYHLFTNKRWWYTKIGKELGISKEAVRAMIIAKFGNNPRQSYLNRQFHDRMKEGLKYINPLTQIRK